MGLRSYLHRFRSGNNAGVFKGTFRRGENSNFLINSVLVYLYFHENFGEFIFVGFYRKTLIKNHFYYCLKKHITNINSYGQTFMKLAYYITKKTFWKIIE